MFGRAVYAGTCASCHGDNCARRQFRNCCALVTERLTIDAAQQGDGPDGRTSRRPHMMANGHSAFTRTICCCDHQNNARFACDRRCDIEQANTMGSREMLTDAKSLRGAGLYQKTWPSGRGPGITRSICRWGFPLDPDRSSSFDTLPWTHAKSFKLDKVFGSCGAARLSHRCCDFIGRDDGYPHALAVARRPPNQWFVKSPSRRSRHDHEVTLNSTIDLRRQGAAGSITVSEVPMSAESGLKRLAAWRVLDASSQSGGSCATSNPDQAADPRATRPCPSTSGSGNGAGPSGRARGQPPRAFARLLERPANPAAAAHRTRERAGRARCAGPATPARHRRENLRRFHRALPKPR